MENIVMKSKKIFLLSVCYFFTYQQTQAGIEEALYYLYGVLPEPIRPVKQKPINPEELPPSCTAFVQEQSDKRRQVFTDILNGKTTYQHTAKSSYRTKEVLPTDYALPDGTTPIRFAVLLKRNHHILQLLEEGYRLTPQDWQTAEFIYRQQGKKMSKSDQHVLDTLKKKLSTEYDLDDYPLIHKGGNIFDTPQAQLVKAAQTNDLSKLRQLLINQVDPNTSFLGSSALELAVVHGHETAVSELLAAGAIANPFHITKAQCKINILATCIHDTDPYPGSIISTDPRQCFENDCQTFNRIIDQLKRNMRYQEMTAARKASVRRSLSKSPPTQKADNEEELETSTLTCISDIVRRFHETREENDARK